MLSFTIGCFFINLVISLVIQHKDNLNQYLIICLSNDHCIGLTDSKNNLNMDCTFIRIDKIVN